MNPKLKILTTIAPTTTHNTLSMIAMSGEIYINDIVMDINVVKTVKIRFSSSLKIIPNIQIIITITV